MVALLQMVAWRTGVGSQSIARSMLLVFLGERDGGDSPGSDFPRPKKKHKSGLPSEKCLKPNRVKTAVRGNVRAKSTESTNMRRASQNPKTAGSFDQLGSSRKVAEKA